MPAYNFQKPFAPDVETGIKRQTIRAKSKRRHARPGEKLQLYTGQRTPKCRKLVNSDPPCKSVDECVMDETDSAAGPILEVYVNGQRVNDKEAFARADGFTNFTAMEMWFRKTYEMPFNGVLIKW